MADDEYICGAKSVAHLVGIRLNSALCMPRRVLGLEQFLHFVVKLVLDLVPIIKSLVLETFWSSKSDKLKPMAVDMEPIVRASNIGDANSLRIQFLTDGANRPWDRTGRRLS